MNYGLDLNELPEQFKLVSGNAKQATIAYTGNNVQLNGPDGVFDEAMKVTGAAKVHVNDPSKDDNGNLLLEVCACR